MSYFMTVSGNVLSNEVAAGVVELVPAASAQHYIALLENALIEEDGGPVYLVHDLESGTSDLLISDLQDALFEGRSPEELPVFKIIQLCLSQAISFRIWLAHNGTDDYKTNLIDVQNIEEVCRAIISDRGAKWSAL